MQLSSQNNSITLSTGDVKAILNASGIDIDGYMVDFPGEYERRGVFIEVREEHGSFLYIITIEGKTVIYLPEGTLAESLEALRDLNNKDMVIFPALESLWKTIETWEASVVVPFGPNAHEFLTKLGQTVESSASSTIKSADFEGEVTRFVALG